MTTSADAKCRATALQLHGLLAHWAECVDAPWLDAVLNWEETERARRSLERRLRCAHLGRFKPLADFDWAWPTQCDQRAIAELMSLDFLTSATNAILVGPAGVGKTTIAQNIAHQAVINGHTVLFATAGQLLGDLADVETGHRHIRELDVHEIVPRLAVARHGQLRMKDVLAHRERLEQLRGGL